MPRKPEQQEDKPQQQTLSVRISESLRKRLEQARKIASKTGERVSTSEIAKQLLESAREERLEIVELLSKSTEALLEIRKKGEAGQALSRAEWTVLASFVQQGSEAFSNNPLSNESVAAILEAFEAAYGIRTARNTERDKYYLGNLPEECRPTKGKLSDSVTPELVLQTAAETRRRLSDPSTKWTAIFAARNLYVLLEEEKLPAGDALTKALRPYWNVLWRAAARGHYFEKRQPIREKSAGAEEIYRSAIPSVSEGGYALSFARGEGNDFSVLLSFPGPRGPMYPVGPYPVISEFRAMVARLTPDAPVWKGEHFYGYAIERRKENELWFRAHANGITFGFSEDEWGAVRKLFRRAWEMPEVSMAWDELLVEYGEL